MEQLCYDIYFKLTDIKFWFDCLDIKMKINVLLVIIVISTLMLYWLICLLY